MQKSTLELRQLGPGDAQHDATVEAISAMETAADLWIYEHGDGPDRRLQLVAAALFFAGSQCGLITAQSGLDEPAVARILEAVKQNFTAGLTAGQVAMGVTPAERTQ